MKWSLSEARKYHDTPLHITQTLELNESMTKRFPEMVLAVEPATVDGYLSYDGGDANLVVNVKVKLTVPSSRSLAPVPLSLDFDFTESYVGDKTHLKRYEKDEVVFVIDPDHGTIDLDSAVAENIIEQLPLRILTKEEAAGKAMPAGRGWQVVSEDQVQQGNNQQVDPRLAKLKQLFPDQDEKK